MCQLPDGCDPVLLRTCSTLCTRLCRPPSNENGNLIIMNLYYDKAIRESYAYLHRTREKNKSKIFHRVESKISGDELNVSMCHIMCFFCTFHTQTHIRQTPQLIYMRQLDVVIVPFHLFNRIDRRTLIHLWIMMILFLAPSRTQRHTILFFSSSIGAETRKKQYPKIMPFHALWFHWEILRTAPAIISLVLSKLDRFFWVIVCSLSDGIIASRQMSFRINYETKKKYSDAIGIRSSYSSCFCTILFVPHVRKLNFTCECRFWFRQLSLNFRAITLLRVGFFLKWNWGWNRLKIAEIKVEHDIRRMSQIIIMLNIEWN